MGPASAAGVAQGWFREVCGISTASWGFHSGFTGVVFRAFIPMHAVAHFACEAKCQPSVDGVADMKEAWHVHCVQIVVSMRGSFYSGCSCFLC